MASLVIAAILLPLGAIAQSQPPRYQFVLEVQVKPGANAQHEEYVKKIVEAAKKTPGSQSWLAFQLTSGGPSGVYSYVLQFDQWADRDSWISPPDLLVKAFGAAEASKIMAAGLAASERSQTSIAEFQPDLSSRVDAPPPGVAANYLVTRAQVIPGKAADYQLALSKIRAAEAKAAGAPRRIARRVIEGDRFLFTSATPFASGAERDRWPQFRDFMSASYSEAEIRQILATLTSSMETSEWFAVTLRPDLSHYDGPRATTN
jgi:antibiotic biosynthesis monooxygenase (ABM) superfamily enzyme